MNRDQLELVLTREGLTRPQTRAVLDAADQYATSQCEAAIDALGVATPLPVMHWQPPLPEAERPACNPPAPYMTTVIRAHVTCPACKATPAWKAT
jgi:hypothetical protein